MNIKVLQLITKNNIANLQQNGFTLLELLVVISLLVILAGFSLAAYEDVQDQAGHDAVIYEMAEIRNALLQFRRDSGTNDFPGQGIYNCTDSANGNPSSINPNIDSQLPSEAGSNNAEKISWCQHPANFWMLFQDPIGSGWNIDTKRGWNGPYLQRKSGFVDVGAIDASGSGANSPTSGAITSNLWGIASPFTTAPINNYLRWRLQTSGDALNKQGSPYLLFDLDDDGSSSTNPARIVSLGQDHDYDGGDTSDCLPTSTDDNGFPVDYILCLLR